MLIDYLISQGYTLQKKTATEWAGPCPSCGGDDRLVVFTDGGRDNGGHYWCRQCNISGDLISWRMDIEGLTFAEAKGETYIPAKPKKRKTSHVEPVHIDHPSAWTDKAAEVLSRAREGLRTAKAAEFFKSRGLTGVTCKVLSFGWQISDRFFHAEAWGLNGDNKLAVPAGAVLPIYRAGRVVSLLVRREIPYRIPDTEREIRFHEVRGGAKVPFFCGPSGAPLVVCESILCAASVYQVSGGQIAALATLGATKPIRDEEAVALLKDASLILIAGDRDAIGDRLLPVAKAIRPDATPYSVPTSWQGQAIKDINDLLQVGGEQTVLGWLAHALKKTSRADLPSAGPEEPEELSDLEVFRRYSPKEPLMLSEGMPDYDQFCTGYTARSCEHCPHYINSGTGLFCQMWEEVYPGRVTWYPLQSLAIAGDDV